MASTVSSPPSKPVSKPSKPTTNGGAAAPSKPVKSVTPAPVDKVSVSEEKPVDSTRASVLEAALRENFEISPSPSPEKPSSPGQRSVELAREFEGILSQDVKGKLEHFQAAGGRTNNCADFVSSILQASGRGITQTPRVNELREQLLEKGWAEIPREEARPGDVWMTTSNTYGSRHTELVASEGGTHTIGSNNVSSTQQRITEREKSGGVYYAYRPELPALQ